MRDDCVGSRIKKNILSQQGVSLFEVIIALVMVSIALLAMLDGMGSIVQTRSYLAHQTVAQEVAWQTWMSLRAQQKAEASIEQSGLTWQIKTSPEATALPNTQQVTVQVTPQGETASVKLSALVVSP